MELNMPMDIKQKDLEILRVIFQKYPAIQNVRLFGSRATGKARRASDIDLAISAPNMSSHDWSEMRAALESAPIIYNMDIIHLEELANDQLRTRINVDGIIIYNKCE